MKPDISSIQHYVAYGSVGASTVRGLKTKGVVASAREALYAIDLKRYGKATPKSFRALLDQDTELVRQSLVKGAQHWGVARKVLNIFLRGSLYNTYLNEHYGLSKIDSLLEIPLDSLSARGIRENAPLGPVPKWVGVKNLTSQINDQFQQLATKIAEDRGTLRVHLDAIFWGGR
jgi:hypothetical protein